MQDNELYFLLKTISVNGSLYMPPKNCSQTHMSLLIQKAVDCGYAYIENGTMKVSDKGRQFLDNRRGGKNPRGTSKWIVPQEQHHEKPIRKTKVVLPKKI